MQRETFPQSHPRCAGESLAQENLGMFPLFPCVFSNPVSRSCCLYRISVTPSPSLSLLGPTAGRDLQESHRSLGIPPSPPAVPEFVVSVLQLPEFSLPAWKGAGMELRQEGEGYAPHQSQAFGCLAGSCLWALSTVTGLLPFIVQSSLQTLSFSSSPHSPITQMEP